MSNKLFMAAVLLLCFTLSPVQASSGWCGGLVQALQAKCDRLASITHSPERLVDIDVYPHGDLNSTYSCAGDEGWTTAPLPSGILGQ